MAHLFGNFWRHLSSPGRPVGHSLGDQTPDILADLDAGRAIPGDLVDALLDDDAPSPRRLDYFAALRHLPEAHDEFDGAESALDALRDASGAPVPDLTGRILSEVHRRKGLLDGRGLRRVSLARWLAAACFVLSAAGLFLIRRAAPEATNFTPTPAPLHDLARSLPAETDGVLQSARSAFEFVRFAPSTPASRNQSCAVTSVACDHPCRAVRRAITTPPVTDDRLVLAAWLESIEELAAFTRIEATRSSAPRSVRSTMPVAWSPASPRNLGEAPVISVRVLLTEPSRSAASSDTPPLDRFLSEPQR